MTVVNAEEIQAAGTGPAEAADVAAAAAEANAAGAELTVEALQAALAETEARVAQHRDEALRARAELDNVRKRAARDVESAHKYGLEKLVGEFLPVKDSLELGLSAATSAAEVAPVREGIDLTLKMFAAALERLGVTEVDPKGQKFNPDLHQAIGADTTTDLEPNTVVMVVQKGYVLRDRLLRPALVRVAAKAPAAGA